MLVARVLRIWRALSALASSTDPLGISASTAFESLWNFGIRSSGRTAIEDVIGLDFADLVGDGRDNVAAKLAVLTHVLAFKAELLLLRHVVSSHGAKLGHDVEQYSLGCAVAFSRVLGCVSHISPGDVHGTVSRESNAIRKLLSPA